MKIKIEYKTDKDGDLFAFTTIDDNYYCAIGNTFDEAKEKLIKRLQEVQKKMPNIIPEPEEVEI